MINKPVINKTASEVEASLKGGENPYEVKHEEGIGGENRCYTALSYCKKRNMGRGAWR